MSLRANQPGQSELSKDVAHAMNLLAHPMAGWAAASAVGFGLATQAWGLWAGTMLGAMENGRRLGSAPAPAREKAETVAAVKARAAAVNLMAEAQSLAREVAQEAPPPQRIRPAGPAKRPAAAKAAPATPEPARKQPAGRPAAMAKPKKPDDLKAIAGIGPKLEQVLNGLGIWTYGQIAGWSDADVAWVEDQLGLSGRIARDGWVAAAKNLAQARGK
jgi:NADH-quinone oxidoreductase subunit E